MPFVARWITSTSASALHAAAWTLDGGTPVDPKLAAPELSAEAAALASDLSAVGLEPAVFFAHAIPLAVRFDAPAPLADVLVRKTLGPRQTDAAANRLAGRLRSLWTAADAAHPDALDELELRSRPLREQWEARGGGLLAGVRRLTDDDAVVDEADVILVQPVIGGAGHAHPLYNALSIEAVLANPSDRLPEIVRLAWLWSQLSVDLPKYQDHVGRAAMSRLGPLALLPPVLSAAQEVELLRFDRPLLETALATWTPAAIEPDELMRWWETYHGSDVTWPVALGALARMLDG